MTEKRFIYVIDNGEDTFYDLSDNGEIMNMIDTEDMLNQLNEENEQLKKENYELHKRLGDFEPFEKYMKERTSKTSVKGGKDWFKTKDEHLKWKSGDME